MVISGQKLMMDENNILTCSKEMDSSRVNIQYMCKEMETINEALLGEVAGAFKNNLFFAQETTEVSVQNVCGQFKSLSAVLLQYSANNIKINKQAEWNAR